MANKKPFYCTTAIDYPNGIPHMGHAYEKIVTDSYNRWYKMLGHETYFVTGTDENGQKLIESAQAAGMDTQAYVDGNIAGFKNLCEKANIKYDDFIRTTEKRHHDKAQAMWKKIEAGGEIYHGNYSGNYCMGCETFYTELQAPDGVCPEHHTDLQKKEEEGYFFKLSNYQDWIVSYLKENPEFVVPKAKYNEILSRLEGDDLRDLAISRPTQGWGVPVPNNDKFVMYTWFDALINYVAVLDEDQQKLWPCDMHVVGKDILWFHAVIWPCMLKACGMELPKQIYVHGMILAQDGKKMSKSIGNVIDPMEILEKYPTDTLRYYLLKNISANSDGKFSEAELIMKHNSELGNDYGNLLMRVIKLARKSMPDHVFTSKNVTQELFIDPILEEAKRFMQKREHNKAMDKLWEFVNQLNQYVNDKEPWKYKTDPETFTKIIYNCLYGMTAISHLLSPFIPQTCETALEYIGASESGANSLVFGNSTYDLKNPESLFPKIG